MSLKAFHLFFISVSALLSVVLMVLGYRGFPSNDPSNALLLGVTGLAIFLALIPYTLWFLKKMKRLPQAALILFLLANGHKALACSVCYGDPNAPMSHGIIWGVWALIGIVGTVLALIATVALSWARRAKSLGSPPDYY